MRLPVLSCHELFECSITPRRGRRRAGWTRWGGVIFIRICVGADSVPARWGGRSGGDGGSVDGVGACVLTTLPNRVQDAIADQQHEAWVPATQPTQKLRRT